MSAKCNPVVLLGLAALTLPLAPVMADDQAPLVALELTTTGPSYDFGMWMLDVLAGEDLTVRWPEQDQAGEMEGTAACVVTWSDPERPGDWGRRMRALMRQGMGMVFVVGAGRSHVRTSRNFWSNLEVDIEQAGGEAGFATWGRHPITEELPNIGVADPQSYISGPGATPLIRFGGQSLAAAFDWGDQGRAVIIDHAILSSQLSTSSPRPALRQFLVRSVLWAAGAYPAAATEPTTPTAEPPVPEEPRLEPLEPMAGDRVLVDIAADDNGWAEIRQSVVSVLEREQLSVRSVRGPEGQERLTEDELAQRGLVVIGAARADFSYSEALALRRFFERGGRILLLLRDEKRPHPRMVALNRLLSELELAASLGRLKGKAEFRAHEITRELYLRTVFAQDEPQVGPGAQVWAWQADPLVTVRGGVAAAALQTENSRLVIMDAGLLLPWREGGTDPFLTLLEGALRWLVGG